MWFLPSFSYVPCPGKMLHLALIVTSVKGILNQITIKIEYDLEFKFD